MKILFMRHGESVDDLTDQYGGWGDFPLTPKGQQQIEKSSLAIKALELDFNKILTSPLMRARESANILSNELRVPVEEFLYVKEKNGYGLLSGMNKTLARELYPELVAMMENGYVYGAEPEDEFEKRVLASVNIIFEMELESVAVVTHGGYLTNLFEKVLERELTEKSDGGFILLEGDTPADLTITAANGIEYV